MKRVNFTEEEDNFLLDNIHACRTLYDLADLFNEKFERHQTNARNITKRLSKLGVKKGTHNIRKEKIKSKKVELKYLRKNVQINPLFKDRGFRFNEEEEDNKEQIEEN